MPEPGPYLIREAAPPDAPGIAAIHVGAWRETYPGLVPDEMLAALSVEQSTAFWSGFLDDPPPGAALFVVEEADELVGFACSGAQRSPDLGQAGFDGEVAALYVLRRRQKLGLGRRLMHAMAARLQAQGRQGASLWVLRDNAPARRFYEALGGLEVGARREIREAWTLDELAYGWRDLPALAGAAGG
jgi:ribosomal protein S18 acetylase RimI-like enzyme